MSAPRHTIPYELQTPVRHPRVDSPFAPKFVTRPPAGLLDSSSGHPTHHSQSGPASKWRTPVSVAAIDPQLHSGAPSSAKSYISPDARSSLTPKFIINPRVPQPDGSPGHWDAPAGTPFDPYPPSSRSQKRKKSLERIESIATTVSDLSIDSDNILELFDDTVQIKNEKPFSLKVSASKSKKQPGQKKRRGQLQREDKDGIDDTSTSFPPNQLSKRPENQWPQHTGKLHMRRDPLAFSTSSPPTHNNKFVDAACSDVLPRNDLVEVAAISAPMEPSYETPKRPFANPSGSAKGKAVSSEKSRFITVHGERHSLTGSALQSRGIKLREAESLGPPSVSPFSASTLKHRELRNRSDLIAGSAGLEEICSPRLRSKKATNQLAPGFISGGFADQLSGWVLQEWERRSWGDGNSYGKEYH